MNYQAGTLYYLTGTGNSYWAIAWMEEALSNAGVTTRMRPIQNARPEEEINEGPGALLALATPTHGFTTPWAMLRFVIRLPRRRGTHAIVVATRAGSRLGRTLTSGVDGTATYLLALLLILKGYSVRGLMGLDMPSNWTALHSGLRPETVSAIFNQAQGRVARFMSTILSGRPDYGRWGRLLVGLLLLPVSFGYLLMGRFFLGKLFFASDDCTGCGICAANCPLGAIKMWGSGADRRPYWTFRCESAMRCMAYCPTEAIEAGHSWAVILYQLTTIPAATVLLNWLTSRFTAVRPLSGGILEALLEYAYILLSIHLAYLLFSLLLRVRWINKLFTVTTMTHYYRRYHAPGTSLRNLKE